MVKKNYRIGAKVEYAVRDIYVDRGFSVIRSAGSRGPFDLLAYNEFNVVFIQCKNHKPTKKEMVDFRSAKIPAFCRKEMWYKPQRGVLEVYEDASFQRRLCCPSWQGH